MTIRQRLLIITGGVFVALLVAFVLVVRFLLLSSFLELESREVRKDLDRVDFEIRDEVDRVQSFNKDWAFWNDTASFIDGRLPSYAQDNLTDSSLANVRISFMVFADRQGRVATAKIIDRASGKDMPVPPEFVEQVSMGGLLLHHGDIDSSYSGVVMVGRQPAVVSSLPILNSEQAGPVHGALIAGVFLDPPGIEALAERTRLSLSLLPMEDPAVAGMFGEVRGKGEPQRVVRPIDGKTIAGYAPLRNISGVAVAVLRLTAPRDTWIHGLRTSYTAVLACIVMGLAFMASIHQLLSRLVLRRMSAIGGFMGRLTSGSPFSERLAVQGNDELSHLSGKVNLLLDTVEKTNLELQKATEEAVMANRTKSEFLANMSHELRTPLNHIIGFTELVVEGSVGPLSSAQKEYLGDVLGSGRHLLSLINDILDLSKVEAGKIDLDLSRLVPRTILDNSLRMVTEKALTHGITLSLDLAEAPGTVVADERKVKQVLFNLLSNAVKFTPDGGHVTVKVRRTRPAGSTADVAEFIVSDTGIGVTEEETSRIFTPYARGSGEKRSRYEGTGLGLALSRKLVELHGGKIWVESEGQGKGSSFHFVLPLDGAETAREREGNR